MTAKDVAQSLSERIAPYADVRVVGIPRALMYHRLGTKWRTFFEALGREVVLSPASDRAVFERGQLLSVDECCLTSKLYLGHVAAVAPLCDAVFVPSFALPGTFRSYCTKFQALPDLVTNAFALVDEPVRVMSALIAEGADDRTEREGYVSLGIQLGATAKEARLAWKQAKRAQEERDAALAEAQRDLVRRIRKVPEGARPLTILVSSHPYVAHDPFVGGTVTDALRAAGAEVLFADEFDHAKALKKADEFSRSLPWIVNRELVGAILSLHEYVDGIVLMSAFPCGPDSMTNDAIARCVRGKPVLTLTLDAQSGSAGVETRVESFVDILTYQKRGGYFHE